MANDALVVIANQMRGDRVGPDAMKLRQHISQRIRVRDLPRTGCNVEFDPVARRQDHKLAARESLCQEVKSDGVLSTIEGERLTNRGWRGPMIDPQSQ
jgi:hypothetical protein